MPPAIQSGSRWRPRLGTGVGQLPRGRGCQRQLRQRPQAEHLRVAPCRRGSCTAHHSLPGQRRRERNLCRSCQHGGRGRVAPPGTDLTRDLRERKMSMTAKEVHADADIRRQLHEFRAEVGEMATLMIHVELFGKMFTAALYPDGIGAGSSRNRLAAKADTLEDLLARLRALWNEAGARHRAARIRSMALAIIRITAERSEEHPSELQSL